MALAQVTFILAALGLALLSLNSKHQNISFSHVSIGWLLLGAALYFIFFFVFSIHWTYALFMTNQRFDRRQILSFFASQPYKYLPSSIFSMSSRSIYARQLGAKLIDTAKAQLRENLSLAVSGGMLILAVKTNLAVAGIAILMVGIFFGWWAHRKHWHRLRRYIFLISLSTLAWLISALAFKAFLHGMSDSISYSTSLYLTALTFLASIAAVFVPAGIGVREAILFSQNIGVAPVLAWRVCTIVVDMISGAVAIFIISKNKT